MKTEKMIARVMEMEENDKGVLLFHTDEGMLCFHGDSQHKTMYRYETFCQDKYFADRIFVNPKTNNRETTSATVIDALKNVCGEMYHEIVNPINGIVCMSEEDDFHHYIWEVETYNTSDSKFDGVSIDTKPVFVLPEHNILVINLPAFTTFESESLSDALRPALIEITDAGNHILTEEEHAKVKALMA